MHKILSKELGLPLRCASARQSPEWAGGLLQSLSRLHNDNLQNLSAPLLRDILNSYKA